MTSYTQHSKRMEELKVSLQGTALREGVQRSALHVARSTWQGYGFNLTSAHDVRVASALAWTFLRFHIAPNAVVQYATYGSALLLGVHPAEDRDLAPYEVLLPIQLFHQTVEFEASLFMLDVCVMGKWIAGADFLWESGLFEEWR
jgi:hypothetical protein